MIDYAVDGGRLVPFGCFAEFVRSIAAKENLEPVYVPVKSSELNVLLKRGQVDMIPCTFETRRRLQLGDFTAFLYTTRLEGVCPKKGRKVFDRADLSRSEVKIVVAQGELGWEYAMRSLDLRDDPHRRFLVSDQNRVEDMMHLVARGGYDVALADALSCRTFCRAHPRSVTLAFAETPQDVLDVVHVGTMIPHGDPEYKDWLNQAFRTARRDDPAVQAEEERALDECPGAFTRLPL
jgi:membrane-bound lytic murein transglycosylase MltF